MTVRVLVADDQEAVRSGLVLILGTAPDIEVVGQARDGLQAVAAARDLRPDVVLMDIRMPGRDGIAATRDIVAEGGSVLVLTTFDIDEYVFGALRAGASADATSAGTHSGAPTDPSRTAGQQPAGSHGAPQQAPRTLGTEGGGARFAPPVPDSLEKPATPPAPPTPPTTPGQAPQQ